MAEWPEPEADPEESRRWVGRLAVAGAVGAGLVLLTNGGGHGRLPALSLPSFELPSFEMPEVSMPDLRGRESSDRNPPPVRSDVMGMVAGEAADGVPISRAASFSACVGTIDAAAQTLGPPTLIEDEPDRRVALFKVVAGQLRITCADGTMRVEQSG